MIHGLLLAVLTAFPAMNGNNRACIETNLARIEQQVAEAIRTYPRVRASMLVAVAFSETHLGCDYGEGGGWGAPVDRAHRHTAGTHLHAAAVLARSLEVCHGDELSAARRFRTGLCNPLRQSSSVEVGQIGEQYGRRVIRLAARLEQIAAED